VPVLARAADATWAGPVGDFAWNNNNNWSPAAPPGSMGGLAGTSTDTATFTTPDPGGAGTEIVIDPGRNIGNMFWNVTTAGEAHTIGTTTGNTLYLSAGGNVTIAPTQATTNSVGFNAPLVLLGNYSFVDNATATAAGLKVNTSITAAPGIGPTTLTLGGTNHSASALTSNCQIVCPITDGSGSPIGIVKTDNGVWDVRSTGANSYSGDTVLNGGGLRLNSTGAMSPNSKYIVNQGATFRPSVSGTIKSLTVNSPIGYTDHNNVLRASVTASSDSIFTSINSVSGPSLTLDMSTATGTIDIGIPINLTGNVANEGGVTLINSNTTPKTGWAKNIDLGTVTRIFNVSHSAAVDASGDPDLQWSGVVSGSGGLTKSGAGILKLNNANLLYTGPTSVTAGQLRIQNNLINSTSVSVSGGTLLMQSDASFNHVLKTGAATVSGGKIDLADNKMITTTSLATIQGYIQTGRNGGAWNGGGIVTSRIEAAGATARYSLGVKSAPASGSLGGQAYNAGDTLVMYTYSGDADLTGAVDGDDYVQIDAGYSGSLTGWYNGDFNYSGTIDADDYWLIDRSYATQGAVISPSAPLGGVAAVPEPAGLLSLPLLAGIALRRRRRR
jgi:autotransporter-associated beta strand protein